MGGEFTVGVEEEFQFIDPTSGGLRGRYPGRPRRDGIARQTLLPDAVAPVSADVFDLRARLAAHRRHANGQAAARGLVIAAAGMHPVGLAACGPGRGRAGSTASKRGTVRWSAAGTSDLFDMRVRVAVPTREMAVRAMCGAAPYIPPLLAVAGSSPLSRGRDTGFSSFRTVRRDMFPRVGPPQPVVSAAEYDALERLFAGDGGHGRSRALAWDIQPGAGQATLEFGFFDALPSIEAILLLAACTRALTVMFADRAPPQPSGLDLQVLKENRWRAARFGLEALFIRPDSRAGRSWSAATALTALVERLGPIAERMGDASALAALPSIVEQGTAAKAMRTVYGRERSAHAVALWVAAKTMALDPGAASDRPV